MGFESYGQNFSAEIKNSWCKAKKLFCIRYFMPTSVYCPLPSLLFLPYVSFPMYSTLPSQVLLPYSSFRTLPSVLLLPYSSSPTLPSRPSLHFLPYSSFPTFPSLLFFPYSSFPTSPSLFLLPFSSFLALLTHPYCLYFLTATLSSTKAIDINFDLHWTLLMMIRLDPLLKHTFIQHLGMLQMLLRAPLMIKQGKWPTFKSIIIIKALMRRQWWQ